MDAFDRGIVFYIGFMLLMIFLDITIGATVTDLTWQTGLVFATWFAFKDVVK